MTCCNLSISLKLEPYCRYMLDRCRGPKVESELDKRGRTSIASMHNNRRRGLERRGILSIGRFVSCSYYCTPIHLYHLYQQTTEMPVSTVRLISI